MPWCAECDRYLAPPAVVADGTCPRCGHAVDPGGGKRAVAVEDGGDVGDVGGVNPPIPWHLKLLLGALVVYLGYRAFQLVEWVVGLF